MDNYYTPDVEVYDLHRQWNDVSKEAYLYEKLEDDKTRCGLCPRRCTISPGNVVSVIPPEFVQDRILHFFSFFIAITLLVSIISYDFLKYIKTRELRTPRFKY